MCTIITTVFTVIACFIVYTYMKKKHTEQINNIQAALSSLNLSLFQTERTLKEVETRLITKDMELKELKVKLETSNSINKDLMTMKEPVTEDPKKAGRKPGSKRPYYKKKSGGNPS